MAIVLSFVLITDILNNDLQVNDEVFDLDRVLEADCTLKFLKFDDPEGNLLYFMQKSVNSESTTSGSCQDFKNKLIPLSRWH